MTKIKAYSSKRLDRWLAKIQMSEVPDLAPRKPEFRVSSLPYCPILFLERLVEWHNGAATNTYSMDFYTGIGTVVHETFQRYAKLVQPKSFYGNWKCSRTLSTDSDDNTSTVVKCTAKCTDITTFHGLKVKCPHGLKGCKDWWEYEEILFLHNGLSGHMDCLLKLDGKWYLLDWKTTGTYLFTDREAAIKKGYYPSAKYIEQIETYAILLKEKFGIIISFYAICYVSRNKPTDYKRMVEGHFNFVYKLDSKRAKRRKRILDQQCNNHAIVQALLKRVTRTALDELLENKPCQSKQDFREKMKMAFFGSEICPHSKGLCFEDGMRSHVKGLLSEIRKAENDS